MIEFLGLLIVRWSEKTLKYKQFYDRKKNKYKRFIETESMEASTNQWQAHCIVVPYTQYKISGKISHNTRLEIKSYVLFVSAKTFINFWKDIGEWSLSLLNVIA